MIIENNYTWVLFNILILKLNRILVTNELFIFDNKPIYSNSITKNV